MTVNTTCADPALNPAGTVSPPSAADPQLSTPDPQPPFPRRPGETPRAFGAFTAFFQLGHGRSLQAVAGTLGEKPATVKQWSSKYRWRDRILAFDSGVLQAQAQTAAALHCRQTADWTRRALEFRDQEWIAGQKLLGAALCFLENFGDREVQGMTIGQVSRALQISSLISRQALSGSHVPDDAVTSPLQAELGVALKKAYGPPAGPDPLHPPALNPQPSHD